ncbi:MAG: AsmA family protein [Gammaproteobacteria bacterium]|nr:AsmA family protein [Gammaproteobacteria bacterium]
MTRVAKVLLWLVGGFVALFVLAAIAVYVFFDPNDFREEIANSVKNQTGREMTIEGDISLELFPWLAVEVGKASLGNAPGFGDEPMASFDRASFSVRLLPAILRQEIVVGAADIEALRLNLVVDKRGRSNWSDLAEGGAADESADEAAPATAASGSIDINSIRITDARVRYTDEEAGESITLDGMNLRLGRVQNEVSAVPLSAELQFDMQPDGMSGTLALESVVTFDSESGLAQLDDLSVEGVLEGLASIPTNLRLSTDRIEILTNESRVSMQTLDLSVLDMRIVANVEPFSYENNITPKATIAIDAFSPRTLMQLFDVAPPETADPSALSRVIVEATAEMTATAIELSKMSIKLDDTTFTGALSIPSSDTGAYQFELVGDSIDIARYMEPASESDSAAETEAVPVEIPVDLIRPLNARGKLKLARASLGNIIFENIDVGLNSSNGRMRIFPISSGFFGGTYSGDVRIDVAGPVPVLSMNEKIADVDLARLARAMFQQENVTGAIKGSFVLSGKGADLAAIQRNLAGDLSMELKDGSYIGTDVWYEIRRARALLKGTEPPTAVLPAKTDFSTVRMTGVVTDGVMRSNDLFAELPFMQLTGGGKVDLPEGTVDYALSARIFDRPEFQRNATPEELDELTEAVIPLKITGPLTSPSVKPDIEKLLQKQVEEELKDKLKDKLKGLFD